MIALKLLVVAAAAVAVLATRAQFVDDDDGSNPPPWAELDKYFLWQSSPTATLIQAAVTKQAETFLSAREALIGNISSLEEWQARQATVKELLNSKVFWPINMARTPLSPRVTSSFHDSRGFTVTLLTFESRPKFYIPCALFVPDGAATGNTPAVLFTSGHWPLSFRDTQLQQIVVLNLVMKGMVVLAYDPPGQGERLQYWNNTSGASDLGECAYDPKTCEATGSSCTQSHSYFTRQLFLNNVTGASIWVWDSIRAVDYLTTVPEVDPTRIGVTGCSGGGTQSSYLAAVDDRIGPASIACYMSTFDTDMRYEGSQDGEQIWAGGMSQLLDKPDLLEVRAPKPTFAMLTTNDNVFPLQGGREAVAEAAAAFEAFGAGDNLDHTEAVGPHGWITPNNEAMYGFFIKHFNLTANSTELPLELLTCQQLTVTATGQVASDPAYADAVFLPDLVAEVASVNQALLTEQRKDPATFLAAVPALAVARAGLAPPAPANLDPRFFGSYYYANVPSSRVDSRPRLQRGKGSALLQPAPGDVEKWTIAGEFDCVSTIQLYKPASGVASSVVVVFGGLTPNGLPDSLEGALLQALNGTSYIALARVCGLGEPGAGVGSFGNLSSPQDRFSDFGNYDADHLPLFLDRSYVGIQAGDVLRALQFLRGRVDTAGLPVRLVVENNLHSAVLHALAAGPGIVGGVAGVALVGCISEYASVASQRYYAMPHWMEMVNVLADYDLTDLIATLVPSSVLVVSPTDGLQTPLTPAATTDTFAFAADVFKAANASLSLQPGVFSPGAVAAMVQAWVA